MTIYGYNYTSRYIDQFSVNGQGGGNLHLSTLDAGGGKGSCCISWRDGTPLPAKVRVRWVADYCIDIVKDKYGESFRAPRHLFKEEEVEFAGPVSANPNYFEVHFLPDGQIGIAITDMTSEPRMKLDPNRALPDRPCTDARP